MYLFYLKAFCANPKLNENLLRKIFFIEDTSQAGLNMSMAIDMNSLINMRIRNIHSLCLSGSFATHRSESKASKIQQEEPLKLIKQEQASTGNVSLILGDVSQILQINLERNSQVYIFKFL